MNREAWSHLSSSLTPHTSVSINCPPSPSASIQLWCGFLMSCLFFQMPLLLCAHLFFGDWEWAFFFLIIQATIAKTALISVCALQAALLDSLSPPEETGRAAPPTVCLCLQTDTCCLDLLVKLGNPLFPKCNQDMHALLSTSSLDYVA